MLGTQKIYYYFRTKGVAIWCAIVYNRVIKRVVTNTERRKTMNAQLIERMNSAMEKLGGAIGIMNLPEEVKTIIVNCNDYETRVKMLEMVCEQLGK